MDCWRYWNSSIQIPHKINYSMDVFVKGIKDGHMNCMMSSLAHSACATPALHACVLDCLSFSKGATGLGCAETKYWRRGGAEGWLQHASRTISVSLAPSPLATRSHLLCFEIKPHTLNIQFMLSKTSHQCLLNSLLTFPVSGFCKFSQSILEAKAPKFCLNCRWGVQVCHGARLVVRAVTWCFWGEFVRRIVIPRNW
jgi:hypothetical protein